MRVIIILLVTVMSGLATAQQTFPARPIRIIAPFAPGGTADILARVIAPKLSESLGQPVFVENRPGTLIIASQALLSLPPDGHSVILTGNTHVLVPLLAHTTYDAIKDFAPVATLARTGLVLVTHPSVPATTLKEFIALAKSRPGYFNCASAAGSVNQLALEMFNGMAGVKIVNIPYKGSGPAVNDLIGGQAQLGFQTPAVVLPHIKSGRLRALAISGDRPMSDPNVPTFEQAGLAGFDVGIAYGLLARAGTPQGVVDRLNAEVGKILSASDFKEKLASQGLDSYASSPEQYAASLKDDMARFAKAVQNAGMKGE